MKFVKIIFWILLGFGAMFVFYRWYRCNGKGEDLQKITGKPFKCPFFCSEPTILEVQDTFHQMLEGKCYEVTDYGKEMNYRIVDLEACGEKPPVMKSESLAEYQMIDE